MRILDVQRRIEIGKNMYLREKIKSVLLKYSEYHLKYLDGPLPLSQIIKKYLLRKDYDLSGR